MHLIPKFLAVAFSAVVMGCTAAEDPATSGEAEYVITGRSEGRSDGRNFEATDIRTQKRYPVAGIKETTGRVYIASMSSLPECNRKVVQGLVSGDSLFITTKVVRDTTVPTVGQ